MRLLPILWAEPPTPEDWRRLSAAREALGYTELIKPVKALPGSPGPVLAIGTKPTWLTGYAHVESTRDKAALESALYHCIMLEGNEEGEEFAELISHWMGVRVSIRGEESYDEGHVG